MHTYKAFSSQQDIVIGIVHDEQHSGSTVCTQQWPVTVLHHQLACHWQARNAAGLEPKQAVSCIMTRRALLRVHTACTDAGRPHVT